MKNAKTDPGYLQIVLPSITHNWNSLALCVNDIQQTQNYRKTSGTYQSH